MYEFTKNIVVEGRRYEFGDRAAKADIPAGCVASLLGLGIIVPVDEPAKAPEATAEPEPTKKTKGK